MKIAVIGANGMVGKDIATEARDRGHEVTAYSRSGANNTMILDLSDTAGLVDAINSHDLTVISVASRDNYDVAISAHQALIAAAPAGRVMVVGGAGALEINGTRLYDLPTFPKEYAAEAQTFGRVLDEYRTKADALNWTMVAPSPVIQPGERNDRYVTALDTPAGDVVTTQDFAVAIIDEAEKPQFAGRRFTVASVA